MRLRALAVACVVVAACAPRGAGTGDAFTGSARCVSCHEAEGEAWRPSQHAAAMQKADSTTVLGDFADARVTIDGVTSRFFRRDGRYLVHTMGPDGTMQEYEVLFTFGVAPLQQYLVAFPGGRLQPLTLSWDTRPAAAGGQRWFALDVVAPIGADDDGHWTGRAMNWNYMCADCHATAVRKEYALAADTFATRYLETGVGCEGCHGPGEAHARWASGSRLARAIWTDPGLPNRLDERRGIRWGRSSDTAQPRRSAARTTSREIDTCAQCHALRVHVAEGYVAGAPLMDFYDPMPLVSGLYHADGQQRDEVYNHGSFLQSRMHAAGVTCSDCHDPHSQRLRAPGNAVCAQCHLATRYDTTAHHGHARGSRGSECAACHMPVTTYLEIDGRHDHSIRIPRPDRSAALGVPDGCAGCHAGRGAAWAVDALRTWRGPGAPGYQRFAEVFAAADAGRDVADSLAMIAVDTTQPVMVRRSALTRLGRYPGGATRDAAMSAARDRDALVRRGAVDALMGLPLSDRIAIGAPLLGDSLRAVRLAVTWQLAAAPDTAIPATWRVAFTRAREEFIASQRYNGDRAEHRTTLGAFHFARGDTAAAELEFRWVTTHWPRHVPAWTNLAGVLSLRRKEGEAEATLRDAIRRLPDEGELKVQLGLSLARQGRVREAIGELEQAQRLAPSDAAVARTLAALRRAPTER